ncbi:hypothetical protein FKM82_020409 [Ascaphus truei]
MRGVWQHTPRCGRPIRPRSRCARWRGWQCSEFPTSRGILASRSRSPLAAQLITRCGASAARRHHRMVFPSFDASRGVAVSQWGGEAAGGGEASGAGRSVE